MHLNSKKNSPCQRSFNRVPLFCLCDGSVLFRNVQGGMGCLGGFTQSTTKGAQTHCSCSALRTLTRETLQQTWCGQARGVKYSWHCDIYLIDETIVIVCAEMVRASMVE